MLFYLICLSLSWVKTKSSLLNNNNNFIAVEFHRSLFDFTLQLCDQKNTKPKYFYPNMQINFTFYFHEKLNNSEIQILDTGTFNHNNNSFNYSYQQEKYQISNKFFYFYYYNTTPPIYRHNILSLAPKSNNINGVLPLSLYEQKIIMNPSFSFYLHEPSGELGNIFFGGLPNHIKERFPYFSSCESDVNRNSWNCNLTSTFIEKGYQYINTYPMLFQSHEQGISAPSDFLSFLGDIILNKFKYKKDWKCYLLDRSYSFMECQCEVVDSFPSITFVFGETVLEVPGRDLFRKSNSMCRLIFYQSNSNSWEFDISIFKSHPTTFNYLNNTITFQSSSPFIRITQIFFFMYCRILLISLSIILLVSIPFEISTLIKFKSNNF